jgi:hypothetical protein
MEAATSWFTFRRLNVSEAAAKMATSSSPAASARSSPRTFGTSAV